MPCLTVQVNDVTDDQRGQITESQHPAHTHLGCHAPFQVLLLYYPHVMEAQGSREL